MDARKKKILLYVHHNGHHIFHFKGSAPLKWIGSVDRFLNSVFDFQIRQRYVVQGVGSFPHGFGLVSIEKSVWTTPENELQLIFYG
jgi:hypothetical protein